MGINAEDVLKAAAAGTGGYMLMAYSDEQGIMLPAGLAVLSAMPAGSRNKAIKQATDAGKKLKLSPADKRIVAEALEGYDTAPLTIKSKDPVSSSSNGDADFRLQQLKDKNASGTFTDADALEAHSLLEDRGVLSESSFDKSATTQTTLLEEAKGFDSADAFVKAQGKTVFRGGDEAIDVSRGGGKGISVADKETAELFTPPGSVGKGVVDEVILPNTAKVLKENKIPEALQKAYMDEAKKLADPAKLSNRLQKSVIDKQQAIVEYARKNGFDAVEFPFEKEIRVIKPNVLKTKSQLTDIWKQANQ
jgi:hypothetical protein